MPVNPSNYIPVRVRIANNEHGRIVAVHSGVIEFLNGRDIDSVWIPGYRLVDRSLGEQFVASIALTIGCYRCRHTRPDGSCGEWFPVRFSAIEDLEEPMPLPPPPPAFRLPGQTCDHIAWPICICRTA